MSKFDLNGIQEILAEQVPTPTEDGAVIDIKSSHKDDKATIIDKVNKIAYLNLTDPETGEDKWYAKSLRKVHNWYETAKGLCVSVFGYVWEKLQKLANALITLALKAIFTIIGVVCVSVDGVIESSSWGWNKITSFFSKKKTEASPTPSS